MVATTPNPLYLLSMAQPSLGDQLRTIVLERQQQEIKQDKELTNGIINRLIAEKTPELFKVAYDKQESMKIYTSDSLSTCRSIRDTLSLFQGKDGLEFSTYWNYDKERYPYKSTKFLSCELYAHWQNGKK